MESYYDIYLEDGNVFDRIPELANLKSIPIKEIHEQEMIIVVGVIIDDVWLEHNGDVEPDENGYINKDGKPVEEDGYYTFCLTCDASSTPFDSEYKRYSNIAVTHKVQDGIRNREFRIAAELKTDEESGESVLLIYNEIPDCETTQVRLKYKR